MNYSAGSYAGDTGYDYYTHEQYVLLKPVFVENGGKQFAMYTFQVTDDSYSELAATRATLAGAGDYGDYAAEGADLSNSANAMVTPVNTITIFVEYNNTMAGEGGTAGGQYAENGVGTVGTTGALEAYNNFHEEGYNANVWTNADALYCCTAGVAGDDFIAAQAKEEGRYASYLANDPIYVQNDVGSFFYLMKNDDEATAAYWDAYDRYLEENPDEFRAARAAGAVASLDIMNAKVAEDMADPAVRAQMKSTTDEAANGDYIYWSDGQEVTFSVAARTREDALIYVHIYDKWGNHYTNILQRDLEDLVSAQAIVESKGQVTVNELGGAGVANVAITELNTQTPAAVTGMTDGVWNSANNRVTITVPEGGNNYQYTLRITDRAGNEQSVNFQADEAGTVTLTVNDEIMGGKYAAAAAGETSEDTQKPGVYTFTVNGEYTANLFSSTYKVYEVTLRSTTGGSVKAYVDGEYASPSAGKIAVPAGSQVQVQVTANAGNELESLTMTYPNGRTLNMVGAYYTEITDDVTIQATFVTTETLLTITVENGAIGGKQQMMVSPYSRVTVVAHAAPEGQVFAYWAQDGEDDVPVSYDEIYTFIAMTDVNLKAIYADAAATQEASVVMDAKNEEAQITIVNGMYTLSYSGKITVPDDAQIVEYGLLLTNQKASSCTNENFVIGGKINGVNVAKLAGKTLNEEGQCIINVNNVKQGQTRTGRMYLTVRLADGTTQTIYSNTWVELNTPKA